MKNWLFVKLVTLNNRLLIYKLTHNDEITKNRVTTFYIFFVLSLFLSLSLLKTRPVFIIPSLLFVLSLWSVIDIRLEKLSEMKQADNETGLNEKEETNVENANAISSGSPD